MSKKGATDQKWPIFKQLFDEEYRELIEETKVTNVDDRLHSANTIQDIGGALEHLALTEIADEDVVT